MPPLPELVEPPASPLDPPDPVASVLPPPVDPVEPDVPPDEADEPEVAVDPASAGSFAPVESPEAAVVAPSGDLVVVPEVRPETTWKTGAVLSASKTSDFDLG